MKGPERGYMDFLETVTLAKSRAEQLASKLRSSLRPSSAGTCTRALAFKESEYSCKKDYQITDEMTSNVHRLLHLGSFVEDHVKEQLQMLRPEYEIRFEQHPVKLGFIESQIKPGHKQEITGAIDLVLWNEHHRCLIDVKSKKDWGAGKFQTHWAKTTKKLSEMKTVVAFSTQAFCVDDLEAFLIELKDPFFEANFLQLNMYAHDPFLESQGIDHCAVFQYNKNTSEMREIRFIPSIVLFQKCMKKFQVAMDAGLLGQPESAPRDYEKESIACRYCRFLKQCNAITAIGMAKPKEALSGI